MKYRKSYVEWICFSVSFWSTTPFFFGGFALPDGRSGMVESVAYYLAPLRVDHSFSKGRGNSARSGNEKGPAFFHSLNPTPIFLCELLMPRWWEEGKRVRPYFFWGRRRLEPCGGWSLRKAVVLKSLRRPSTSLTGALVNQFNISHVTSVLVMATRKENFNNCFARRR